MNWRQDDVWQIFWAPEWLEGLTLPPNLTLDDSRTGVQKRTYYDPALNRIVASMSQRDVAIVPPRLFTPAEYAQEMTRVGFNSMWRDETERTFKTASTDANGKTKGGLVNIDLPFQLPKGLSSVFGEGAPNLRVSGSEQISMGGTSSWHIPEYVHEGRRPSHFPSLEMRQLLNVRLNGTIGDKLHIDIAQNSEASTPLENQIKIYYQGYDDDVIQRVDLGNTNLSLPHTQYISLNARQEGLFGVKMLGRLADWDFAAIASKQEGQADVASYSGGSRETAIGGDDGKIYDYEYEKRKFFLLFDPDTSATFQPDSRIDPSDLVVFINRNDNIGDRQRAEELLDSVRVTVSGEPDTTYYKDQFVRLRVNDDYYFITSDRTAYPILEMRSSLAPEWTLAVAYRVRNQAGEVTATVGNYLLPHNPGDIIYLKMIYAPSRKKTNDLTVGPWAPTRRLELKNIYDLGVRNIDPESFKLEIHREGGSDPAVLDSVSYLEVLGLDVINNQTQLGRVDSDKPGDRGPDLKVDPQCIDYENGLVFFPDLRPFDPSPIDLNGAADTPENDGFRAPRTRPRARALGYQTEVVPKSETNRFGIHYARDPARAAEVNSLIYDRDDVRADYRKYYMKGTFRAVQTSINLNRMNILENSETVRMNGDILARGQDYTISYDTGEVRLLSDRATNPNGNLQITYSYTPIFARGDRSLIGFSTTYGGSPNWDLSSTLLYESKGSPDFRPKLQAEPSRTILGDLSGSWRARPWLLTEIADALPLVHTTAPSNISLSGALGVSVPNPNTRGNVYLDDMEGVVQTTSAGVSRENWHYSSRPQTQLLVPSDSTRFMLRDEDRLGAVWYSLSRQIQASDLNPKLNKTEGNDFVSALGIILLPNQKAVKPWVGVVQQLAETAVNLGQSQYIELWINDFNQFHGDNAAAGAGKALHIDLGHTSEDAVWDPRTPPEPANGKLDTEDPNNTGQLVNDTGLDGIADAAEKAAGVVPDSTEFTPSDPGKGDLAGDDYDASNTEDYSGSIAELARRFRHVNGTEGNQRIDSEDLDKTGSLDESNNYYEYTIPLNSDEYTVVDVKRDFGRALDSSHRSNGWRLLRIPLNHPSRQSVGAPDLMKVSQVRIWFDGFSDTTRFELASLDVVGNRWERQRIRAADGHELPDNTIFDEQKVFNVAVVNNKENSDYVPPFGVREINGVPEREQSLNLDFENLDPGEQVSAFRPQTQDEDYTLYQTLSYYIQPRIEPFDSLEFFVRFSSSTNNDSANVYEMSTRQLTPNTWRSIDMALADLSSLKIGVPDSVLARGDALTGQKQIGDVLVKVYGRPSFNQIRRLQVGVRNIGSRRITKGQLWFNELRLGNVRKDLGIASRGAVSMALGDFAQVSASFSQVNADFLTLGQSRDSKIGSGTTARDMNISTGVNLDKMLPSIGLLAPVRLDLHNTRNVPKFKASNDIIFTGAGGGADITQSGNTAANISLRRMSDQNTPWFIRSTIDALAMNLSYTRSYNNQTTAVDSGMVVSGNVSYALRLANPPGLPLPGRGRFTPLPNSFTVSYTGQYTRQSSYQRDVTDATRLKQLALKSYRTGGLQMQTNFQPLTPITYNITSQRDLINENFALSGGVRPTLKIAGVDLGREVSRSERAAFSQSFALTSFFRPRITWNGDYNEDHRPQIVTPTDIDEGDVPPDLKNIENKNSTTVGVTLPISRLFSAVSGTRGGMHPPTRQNRRPGDVQVVTPERPPGGGAPVTTPVPATSPGSTPSGTTPPPGSTPSAAPSSSTTTPPTAPAPRSPADTLRASPALPPAVEPARADTSGTARPPVAPARPDTSGTARPPVVTPRPPEQPGQGREGVGKPKQPASNEPGPNLFRFLFHDLLSIGDIKANFTTSNRNTLTRVFGTPPPEFRLGLSDRFGDVARANGSVLTHTNSNSATANGTVQVLRDFTVDANYQWNDQEMNNNNAVTRTTTTTWPSLRMNLGALERKLKLGWLFSSFTASSNFERREEVAGSATNRRERVTTTDSWRPFFQFDASLKNGWRTTFSTDRSTSLSQTNSAGLANTGVTNKRSTQSYRLGLAKSLGGRQGGGRSSVDLNVDMTYSKDTSVTTYAAQPAGGLSNGNDTFQGRFSTSYRFTSTVSGTMQFSVGQRRDLVQKQSDRTMGLQATAGISF